MNDYDFAIPYIIYTVPNSLSGQQLPTQAKNSLWVIYISGEEPITDKGALD